MFEKVTTLLIEEAEEGGGLPTEASVYNLLPATEYSATLSVRLARLGTRKWQATGLEASFITPECADAQNHSKLHYSLQDSC